MLSQKAMLIDVSKCMACRACQVACKQWNQLPAVKTHFSGTYQNPPKLSANTWTLIQFIEPEEGPTRWLFRKQQCLHCGDPACVQACPTGALKKRPDGIVYIDQNICAGCKYCVEACPFGTPQADHKSGTAKKCRMCLDRVDEGLQPACATACPTGAVLFGTRADMLKTAKKRQAVLAKRTGKTPRIYGETELGGLGVMYLLPEKASMYGLPEDPKKPLLLPKWLVGIIPGAAILYGIWRNLARKEAEAAKVEQSALQTEAPQQSGKEE